MVYPIEDLEPEKVDIKYIGVPNVCFSLTEPDDDREPEFSQQRRERGFDSSELWSLDYTIARFIYPRLKAFRETTCGYPGGLESEKEWDDILQKIEIAFGYILEEDFCKHEKEIEEGMILFKEWFFALWT